MTDLTCAIEGVTPLLMHRFGEVEEVGAATRRVHVPTGDPREQAERVSYRDHGGVLCLPGAAFARMLREAGSGHKQRGSRKSLKYIIPAAVLVHEEYVRLLDKEGKPLMDFEVDSRPVVIPATKGRIMRHRPRLNYWAAEVSFTLDDEVLDSTTINQLFVDGGSKIGLGDYRPEKGGPFGRFHIVRWAEIAQKKAA